MVFIYMSTDVQAGSRGLFYPKYFVGLFAGKGRIPVYIDGKNKAVDVRG